MATPAQTSAQAQDTDERALRKVFSKLVEGMKATDVIDELYECNLLRREEYEGILDACSKEDSKTLNRRVLMAISRRPPGFAAKLAEIFRKKHSYLADALEEALAEVNCQPQADPAPTPDPSKDAHPSSSGSGVTSGPMSQWNVDALVALKGKLKLNVKMIALANILETPAGGFMSRTEAQSVRAKTGDDQQMELVIEILLGKGDKEFATFCQMLRQSNYQVWAHELEVEAETFKMSDAVPDTNPAPLRQNPQAVMSAGGEMPGPSREGGIPTLSANSTTHPLSPTLNNICWPEFPALQDEFSTLVSKLSLTLQTLEKTKFDGLLAYLRERLRPMVDGCFPTEGSPNLPKGITASDLVQHLQDCHYWDYLNTDLLEGIIRHVSGERSHLVSLMTKYKKNICSKVKRTLKECRRKNVKPEPPPHYNIMAVEIDPGGNPLSFHLYQILQLKNLLVQKFGMSGTLFHGFTEGSIVLYFYIPEEAVYSLCPKLEANCTALEEMHVTTLVVFGHFSVDVGYQQMSILHKSWSSQVSSMEEEVTRLKQQLKKSEVDREKLSAELKECRKIKLEPGVYTTKPVLPKKHRLKEEGEEEEPDRKRVKTEVADTVEVKLESHPQEEKEGEAGFGYGILSLGLQAIIGDFSPHVFSGARPPVPQPYSFQQPVQMGPPGSQTTQVPSQVGAFPPHVFSGARPPLPQPSSFQQPVQMGPHGSQRTQVGVFPPRVSSGARPPVTQHSSLQPVVPQVPPQAGVSSPYVLRGAIPPYRQLSSIAQPVQLSSIAQPVQTTPLGSQQTQAPKCPPLVLAAGLGQLARVQQLIRDGEGTLEDCDESGHNALHSAAAGGELDMIKFLSPRFGSRVHDKDGDDRTILHQAAYKGHCDVARYVIEDLKLNPQDRDKEGNTALLLAALGGGRVEMARMLLDEFGSTVDEVDNSGHNALHSAAAGGELDMIKFLTPRFGARVQDKDGDDGTILHYAANKGHCDVARYVIEDLKLNPQDRTKYGNTALLLAALGGRVEMARMLLDEFGSTVDEVNNYGNTALLLAALGGSVEMARMLLDEFGSTVDEVNNGGQNALHAAAAGGKVDMIKFLLPRFGARVHDKDGDDRTILHYAANKGHCDVARYVIEDLKLNPQDRTKNGDTALLLAAYGGSVEMARMLLDEFGSTVDEVNNDGYNALHCAATLGEFEVVKYLLPIFGVKRFSITRTGETCLSLARRRGHQEVVRYLLEEGGFKSK